MPKDPTPGRAAPTGEDVVDLIERPVVVVDAGCRWGATDAWAHLDPHLRVYAFDPDADECRRLQRLAGPNSPIEYVPRALAASDGEAAIHVAKEPACSSMYPPDPIAQRERPLLDVAATERVVKVPTSRLDSWAAAAGVDHVDAMKLDVQGAELEVLVGAGALLEGVRVLELEVTFNPIYSGQALFGDIDRHLRRRGFVLWNLGHLVHYGTPEMAAVARGDTYLYFDGIESRAPLRGGQLYWGHAHYVAADIAHAEPTDWRTAVRDAALCRGLGLTELTAARLAAALGGGPPARAAAIIERALGDAE